MATEQKSGADIVAAQKAFLQAEAVCFDVDSTVCVDECINVLAAHCGVGDKVTAYTNSAMNGAVLFQTALRDRLNLMQPSVSQIAKCLKEQPPVLSPLVDTLIARLHERGVHVYLVSGGFHCMIDPIAKRVGIPVERVFANRILHDGEGKFTGFDEAQFTSKSMGKREVLLHLQEQHKYKTLIMIGDGATDLEARPPASAFIGYGGVVVRDKVKAGADWFVMSFQPLLDVLGDTPRT